MKAFNLYIVRKHNDIYPVFADSAKHARRRLAKRLGVRKGSLKASRA